MTKINKILITGNAGSSKTTLSKELSKRLDIHNFGLDKIVWKQRWEKATKEERTRKVVDLVNCDAWIIDGVDFQAMGVAELVVFLDFPRSISYWRIIKRNLFHLFSSRPELPPNCPEILIFPYLIKLIWEFPNKVRPGILLEKEKRISSRSFVHIRSRRDLDAFMSSIDSEL